MEEKNQISDSLEEENQGFTVVSISCKACNHKNELIINSLDSGEEHCKNCNAPVFKTMACRGYVYVLSNPAFEGLLKIGMTNRPIANRIKELSSSTSVPDEFKVELVFPAQNPRTTETQIHKKLEEYRRKSNREFFEVDLYTAYTSIKSIVQFEASRFPAGVTSSGELKDYVTKRKMIPRDKAIPQFDGHDKLARKKNGKYLCNDCGSKLKAVHRVSMVPNEALLTCKQCGKYFTSKGVLIP